MLMKFYEYIKEYNTNWDNNHIKIFHNSKYDDKLTKTNLGFLGTEHPIDNSNTYFYIEFIAKNTYRTLDNKTLITDFIKLTEEEQQKLDAGKYGFFNFKVISILIAKGYDSVKFYNNDTWVILKPDSIENVLHLKDYTEAKEYFDNILRIRDYK